MRFQKFAFAALAVSLAAPLVRADDEADVKAVAVKVINAVVNGDHDVVADNFADTGPDEQLADTLADVIIASKALHEAEVAKFGAANAREVQFDPKKFQDEVTTSTVKVTGDTAELVSANPSAAPHSGMQLKRDGGAWKVVSLTGQAAGRLVMIKILKPMTTAMNEVATGVKAGDYASAAEADAAVKSKVLATMQKTGIVPANKPPQ